MQFPTVYEMLKTEGYDITEEDGAVETRADSGKLRIRRLWSESRYRITFRLGFLSAVNVAAIRQFYQTYRVEEIEWLDPFSGDMFDVLMTKPPKLIRTEGAASVVEVYMEGTKQ